MQHHEPTEYTEEELDALEYEEEEGQDPFDGPYSFEQQGEIVADVIAMVMAPDYKPDIIDADTIKLLVMRLAEILNREVDVLRDMRFSELELLQNEKRRLINALEKQKKLMNRAQSLRGSLSDEEIEEFEVLSQHFHEVMQENHSRLLMAKEVNRRVIQTITSLSKDQKQGTSYTPDGRPVEDPSVAMSLNHSI